MNVGKDANTRIRVAERAGWKCFWCDQSVRMDMGWQNSATIEHVLPKSQGGTNKLSNLTCACYRCNRLRRTQSVDKFRHQAVQFGADTRSIVEAQHTEKQLKRQSKQERFKQIVGNELWSYAQVPTCELNSKERMRRDRTLVKQALKKSHNNPFDPGTRCHRLFEAESIKQAVIKGGVNFEPGSHIQEQFISECVKQAQVDWFQKSI